MAVVRLEDTLNTVSCSHSLSIRYSFIYLFLGKFIIDPERVRELVVPSLEGFQVQCVIC